MRKLMSAHYLLLGRVDPATDQVRAGGCVWGGREGQLERIRKQAKANRASTGFATSASQLEYRRRIVVCCCSKCGPAGREQKYRT